MRKLSIGPRVQRGATKAVASTRFVLGIWLLLGVVGPYFKRFMEGDYDNYKIFKNSFFNLLNEETLYGLHPDTGLDLFLYGPFSCVLIAPFALLPNHIGRLLFLLASALLLFFAIQALPLSRFAKNGACLLCLVEFGNNQQHFQTNAIIAGFIILSLVAFCRRREAVAAMSIPVGCLRSCMGSSHFPSPFLPNGRQELSPGWFSFLPWPSWRPCCFPPASSWWRVMRSGQRQFPGSTRTLLVR